MESPAVSLFFFKVSKDVQQELAAGGDSHHFQTMLYIWNSAENTGHHVVRTILPDNFNLNASELKKKNNVSQIITQCFHSDFNVTDTLNEVYMNVGNSGPVWSCW